MAESLDVLGVIGTWIAAALAVIALAGILPIYLLYRQSKTDRYMALNSVHDPQNAYITPGYLLWPGERFFRTYRVPQLERPPNWAELTISRDCELFSQKDARSLTGWLNFANVLRAYGLNTPPKGKLVFLRQEALLPVHRGWLLLLGIIDRYAYKALRPDKGMFVSELEEMEISDFGQRAIFGLSGVFEHLSPSPESRDLEYGPGSVDQVVFRMHAPEHMVNIPRKLIDDDIPIQTLIALFLGYLVGTDGQYYALQLPDLPVTAYTTVLYQAAALDDAHKILTWQPTERDHLPPQQRRLAQELDIRLPPQIQEIKEIIAPDQGEFDRLLRNNRSSAQSYLLISEKGKGVWISRSSLHLLMLAVLQLKMSRQSALSAMVGQPHNVLDHLFKPAGFLRALENAQKLIHYLQITDEERHALGDAILDLKNHVSRDTDRKRWSRTRMDFCVTLDNTLRRICNTSQLLLRVISILYMQETEFRQHLRRTDTEYAAVPERHFIMDRSSKVVRAPATDENEGLGPDTFKDFYFDFTAVFPASDLATVWPLPMNTYPAALSYPEAMMACLQGHLRMVMWNMMLPAWPLAEFYEKFTTRIAHIIPLESPPGSRMLPPGVPSSPPPAPLPPLQLVDEHFPSPLRDRELHLDYWDVDDPERSSGSLSSSNFSETDYSISPIFQGRPFRSSNDEPPHPTTHRRVIITQKSASPVSSTCETSSESEPSPVDGAKDAYVTASDRSDGTYRRSSNSDESEPSEEYMAQFCELLSNLLHFEEPARTKALQEMKKVAARSRANATRHRNRPRSSFADESIRSSKRNRQRSSSRDSDISVLLRRVRRETRQSRLHRAKSPSSYRKAFRHGHRPKSVEKDPGRYDVISAEGERLARQRRGAGYRDRLVEHPAEDGPGIELQGMQKPREKMRGRQWAININGGRYTDAPMRRHWRRR
jgi:hypothetical protein